MALAKLVGLHCRPGPGASGSRPARTISRRPNAFAAEVVDRDPKGPLVLAAAVGFHKAGQFELALPLSEKAATHA